MKLRVLLAAAACVAQAAAAERILPASPGLDGGGGHWGKQTEADWVDRRWNQMDVGGAVASNLQTPAGPVAKALSIRVGDGGVCYDTAKMKIVAAWTNGFLEFPPERFGLVGSPKIAGTMTTVEAGAGGTFFARHWRGQSLLRYKSGGAERLVGAKGEVVDRSVLEKYSDPFPQEIEVKGQRAKDDDAYVIDTIPLPFENPHKALMFVGGLDFLPNGDAAVCTIHGDVWLVRGIDDSLGKVRWKRFATGLFQPLGLKVVDGNIYVLGRDRITRLRDVNGDGGADDYENFYDGIKTSLGGHDYVTCLETDDRGDFYYVDPIGLHRVARDGSRGEVIASGWRNPNGMGVGPGPLVTVAPQEGEWTPASMICEVKERGYYGYGGPRAGGVDAPLCYIPRLVDNSSGSQVWAPANWGPLSGRMLHLSYGRSSWMLVLRDVVDGQAQGGMVPLKGRFLSGAMRGAVRKQDGQLWIAGAKGWTSNALRDGSLQRVRYTGKKIALPVELKAHADGLAITFSEALEAETAKDVQSYALEQWNYKYRADYGSPEFSVEHPDVVGHDAVEVTEARLGEDKKTVFLKIPKIRPVMQMTVKFDLNDAGGEPVSGAIHHTIHRLRPAFAK